MSGTPPAERRNLKIIPIAVGTARPTGANRQLLREAVVQVIHHLVIEAVPPAARSRYFDPARGVLEEAGWGLDELVAAAEPGPTQDRLFELLGLGWEGA